jgi:hypothetical protein
MWLQQAKVWMFGKSNYPSRGPSLGANFQWILHNIILDYNCADNWRKRVVGGLLLPAEVIDDVPVIENDFFLHLQ